MKRFASFFAVLALPLVRALERRGLPLSLAVLAALAAAFGLLTGGATWVREVAPISAA